LNGKYAVIVPHYLLAPTLHPACIFAVMLPPSYQVTTTGLNYPIRASTGIDTARLFNPTICAIMTTDVENAAVKVLLTANI
jgi:hypothetical protein